MVYQNQDSYIPPAGDILDTEDIVDRDGYRDTRTQVMEMIDAGIRLQEFRREEFEYEEETPDFEIDPTRVPDFDAIDAARIQALETERLNNLAIRRKAEYDAAVKAKEEADKAAKVV